uniref:Uncharacterized protein n=1 Tax=Chlamydomonas euryale TaxID=1486919 RepID=A0A7R9VEC2_9CHLO
MFVLQLTMAVRRPSVVHERESPRVPTPRAWRRHASVATRDTVWHLRNTAMHIPERSHSQLSTPSLCTCLFHIPAQQHKWHRPTSATLNRALVFGPPCHITDV